MPWIPRLSTWNPTYTVRRSYTNCSLGTMTAQPAQSWSVQVWLLVLCALEKQAWRLAKRLVCAPFNDACAFSNFTSDSLESWPHRFIPTENNGLTWDTRKKRSPQRLNLINNGRFGFLLCMTEIFSDEKQLVFRSLLFSSNAFLVASGQLHLHGLRPLNAQNAQINDQTTISFLVHDNHMSRLSRMRAATNWNERCKFRVSHIFFPETWSADF